MLIHRIFHTARMLRTLQGLHSIRCVHTFILTQSSHWTLVLQGWKGQAHAKLPICRYTIERRGDLRAAVPRQPIQAAWLALQGRLGAHGLPALF